MLRKSILSLLFLSSFTCMNMTTLADSNPSDVIEAKIKLYIYPGCPYCNKVINFLQNLKVLDQITILNANQLEHYNDLKAISKRDICPYLVDEVHNVKMDESSKILNYFKQLFS